MRTLTFEQLRINLTLTFDTLDEPIEIVKRGRVVGYLVSNLQDTKDTGKAEVVGETVYEPDAVKPEKVPRVSVKKEVVPVVNALLAGVKVRPTVQHHPQCKCGVC